MVKPCLAILVSIFLLPAYAQEQEKIRFIALTQFVSGTVNKLDSKRNSTPLQHGDSIYEGDRISVGEKSFAKLVSKEGCVTVLYGAGEAVAPYREKSWELNVAASRWICSGSQTLDFNGQTVDVGGSDVLLTGKRIVVFKGPLEGSKVSESTKLNLQEKFPPPAEAVKVAAPAVKEEPKKPREPAKARVLIGPFGGGGQIQAGNKDVNDDTLKSSGVRIQYHRKIGNGSLIIAIVPHEEVDEEDHTEPGQPIPAGVAQTRIRDTFGIEGGWRFNHQRWWSPYARGGVYSIKHDVQYVDPATMNFFSQQYEFLGVGATLGIDAYLRPSFIPWLGLYAAAEANYLRTLAETGSKNTCENCTPIANGPDVFDNPFSLLLIQIGLGLIVQF